MLGLSLCMKKKMRVPPPPPPLGYDIPVWNGLILSCFFKCNSFNGLNTKSTCYCTMILLDLSTVISVQRILASVRENLYSGFVTRK